MRAQRGSVLVGVVVLVAVVLIGAVALGAIFGKQLDQQRSLETRKRLEMAFQAMFPYPQAHRANMFTDFGYRPDPARVQVMPGYATAGFYLDGLLDINRVGVSDGNNNPPPSFTGVIAPPTTSRISGAWNGPYWTRSLATAQLRPLDAWGRPLQLRYVSTPQPGWQVFSRGPNGLDDTPANAGTPGGDDLAYPDPPYALPPLPPPHWQKNGTTTGYSAGSGGFLLTGASTNQKGSVFWSAPVDIWTGSLGIVMDFDIRMGGGSGADGMALCFADFTADPTMKPTFLDYGDLSGNMQGAWDGANGLTGAFIGFDTYRNSGDPVLPGGFTGSSPGGANFVGLCNGGRGTLPTWESTQVLNTPLRSDPATLHIQVVVAHDGRSATITVGSETRVLNFGGSRTFPQKAYVGFTGSTGGSTDLHWLGNMSNPYYQ